MTRRTAKDALFDALPNAKRAFTVVDEDDDGGSNSAVFSALPLQNYVSREARLFTELVYNGGSGGGDDGAAGNARLYRFSTLPLDICTSVLRHYIAPPFAIMATMEAARTGAPYMDDITSCFATASAALWRSDGGWDRTPLANAPATEINTLVLPDRRVLYQSMRATADGRRAESAVSLFAPLAPLYRAQHSVREYAGFHAGTCHSRALHLRMCAFAFVYHARSDTVLALGGLLHSTACTQHAQHTHCAQHELQSMRLNRAFDEHGDRVGSPWQCVAFQSAAPNSSTDVDDYYGNVRGALVSDESALAVVGVDVGIGSARRDVAITDLYALKECLYSRVLARGAWCTRDAVHAHDANTLLVSHVAHNGLTIEQLDLRENLDSSSASGVPSARVLSIVDARTRQPFFPSNCAAVAAAAQCSENQHMTTTTTTRTPDVGALRLAEMQAVRQREARGALERVHLFSVADTSLASSGGAAAYSVGVVGVDCSTFAPDTYRASPAPLDERAVYHTVAWVGAIDLRNLRASQRDDMCRMPIRSAPLRDIRPCLDVCVVKQF